ncbi:MAG: hypothetical protein IJU84_03935, partial [Clostridia bacterium]|nr:hypothetical protein [Clostridia bacterium]
MEKTNFLIKTLFLCLCVSLSAFFVSCKNSGEEKSDENNTETLKILNWQDETEEVVLGTCYDVVMPIAKDADGNEYAVNVAVVKSVNGAVIPLIYDAFDILSLGGYEIRYIASDGNRKAVKTVRLTVVDTSKPVVILTGENIAEKGSKYYYPTINASDNSGEKCTVSVVVTDPDGENVSTENDGFMPVKVGLYTLSISAADAFGNVGTASFEVFAREPIGKGELDAFDDAGLSYTAYTSLNSEKTFAEFTSLKCSSSSKGSAMFVSTKGDATNIYITPRINALDVNELGDDTHISVSVYIADNYRAERTLTTGSGERVIPTNVWNYVDISKDEVGNLGRFVSTMSKGEKPLISVGNTDRPYVIFIDDVFIRNSATESIVSGLKSAYATDEQVSFSLKSGYVAETWSCGRITAATSGMILDHDGTYTLICRPTDGLGACAALSFRVGARKITTALDKVYSINFDNALPTANVYNGNSQISAAVTYYDLGLYTGEVNKLNGTVHPEKINFALVAEAEVSGKKVSEIVFLKSKYTSDAFAYMGAHNGGWTPIMSDMGNQADPNVADGYANMDIIGNFCYHIESYGSAPWIRFNSLKNYMNDNSIDEVTIKVLMSAPSKLSYKFGEYDVSHFGISYKTGEVLTFEHVTSDDISHLQVIWGTAEIYVMAQLPNYRTVTSETAVGEGEVTLIDDSASVFADCSDLKCVVVYPDGTTENIANGKFTQREKGTYTVKYSATTTDGEKVFGAYKLKVGLSVVENGSIWDFSDPSIIENDVKESDGRNYYVEYLEEFEGEKGVVAVTNMRTGDWNWDIWFLSGYTAFADSISAEADTLFIRLKANATGRFTLFGGGADAGESLVLYEYPLTTGWTTVAITGDRFNAFKTHLSNYRGALQAWMEKPGTVYIADFYVGKTVTVTSNAFFRTGEVTLDDDSATVFSGYTKLVCEVKAPDNTLITVTDGKFVPTDNGVYTVNYYALMPSGVIKTGSYAITCLEKNDLGTFVPSASDWHQQGGSSYTATVVDN